MKFALQQQYMALEYKPTFGQFNFLTMYVISANPDV